MSCWFVFYLRHISTGYEVLFESLQSLIQLPLRNPFFLSVTYSLYSLAISAQSPLLLIIPALFLHFSHSSPRKLKIGGMTSRGSGVTSIPHKSLDRFHSAKSKIFGPRTSLPKMVNSKRRLSTATLAVSHK